MDGEAIVARKSTLKFNGKISWKQGTPYFVSSSGMFCKIDIPLYQKEGNKAPYFWDI